MSRTDIDDQNEYPEDPEQILEGEPRDADQPADDEIARLRTEVGELRERLARATADFQNSRRRLEGELDQRVQYAHAQLIKSLLPVIDNFERALAVDPARSDAAAVLKGLQLVHDQWMNVLQQQQVEQIAPAAGEPFDPNHHEALMQVASDQPEGALVQLFQKGYAINGRALRPAQVAVSKGE